MLHIKEIYPKINLSAGLPALLKSGMDPIKAFDYQVEADTGKITGLWTHSNVRKDKLDCYPHHKLVELLVTL